eukprot:6280062-Amphidinium_carterae.1
MSSTLVLVLASSNLPHCFVLKGLPLFVLVSSPKLKCVCVCQNAHANLAAMTCKDEAVPIHSVFTVRLLVKHLLKMWPRMWGTLGPVVVKVSRHVLTRGSVSAETSWLIRESSPMPSFCSSVNRYDTSLAQQQMLMFPAENRTT